MIGNKNKSKSTKTPLAELQNLQSELHSLREKHIAALESELLVFEKEEVSQKSRIDKTRDQLNHAKQRLKEQHDAKPSIQARTQASIDNHQAHFDSYQAELAQLRSKMFEQKLAIRKEKAVLKAIIDTEKALKKPEKAASPTKPKQAVAVSEKATPKIAAAKTKKPSPSSPPGNAKKPPAQPTKTATKISNIDTDANSKPETPDAPVVSTPTETEAVKPAAQVAKEIYSKPRRRVRRMSDIPSHPDKAGDRLASLFDDF